MKFTFTRDVIKNVNVVRLTKSNKEQMLNLYDNIHKYYLKAFESNVLDKINIINAKKFENSDFTGIPEIIDIALILANKYIEEED